MRGKTLNFASKSSKSHPRIQRPYRPSLGGSVEALSFQFDLRRFDYTHLQQTFAGCGSPGLDDGRFIVWDGKSAGSQLNLLRFLQQDKTALIDQVSERLF